MIFTIFALNCAFPKPAIARLSQQPPHTGTMPVPGGKTETDLEHCYPGDISQPLDIHSSQISWQDRCLAALKVYIAQINPNFLLLKTVAFPAESCVTNSLNLPWVYFSGAFPIKAFSTPALLLPVPSLPSQLSSRLKSVGCRNVPHSCWPFCHLLPQSMSPSCGRGKDVLDWHAVSHVTESQNNELERDL